MGPCKLTIVHHAHPGPWRAKVVAPQSPGQIRWAGRAVLKVSAVPDIPFDQVFAQEVFHNCGKPCGKTPKTQLLPLKTPAFLPFPVRRKRVSRPDARSENKVVGNVPFQRTDEGRKCLAPHLHGRFQAA
jgi:hypothetical protein